MISWVDVFGRPGCERQRAVAARALKPSPRRRLGLHQHRRCHCVVACIALAAVGLSGSVCVADRFGCMIQRSSLREQHHRARGPHLVPHAREQHRRCAWPRGQAAAACGCGASGQPSSSEGGSTPVPVHQSFRCRIRAADGLRRRRGWVVLTCCATFMATLLQPPGRQVAGRFTTYRVVFSVVRLFEEPSVQVH